MQVSKTDTVLIVDDERTFSSPRFDDAVYARNSKEALGVLAELWTKQYTGYGDGIFRLYLDHDLGIQDGEIDDTEIVVNFLDMLAQTKWPLLITEICIHSQNPTSERFIATLRKHYTVSRIRLPECVSDNLPKDEFHASTHIAMTLNGTFRGIKEY